MRFQLIRIKIPQRHPILARFAACCYDDKHALQGMPNLIGRTNRGMQLAT